MRRFDIAVLAAVLAIGIVVANLASAAQRLEESFDYPAGTLRDRGGWCQLPSGSSNAEVIAGSLSFGGIASSGGKRLLPSASVTRTAIRCSVDWDVDGSRMVGFMVRKIDFANMGAFFNFGLGNSDTAATELLGRGGIGSTERFVMNWTGDLDTHDNAYTLAATVFIVMKITAAAGDNEDTITLEFYDTPDADGGVVGATPVATLKQSKRTVGKTSHVVFVAGSNVAVCWIDEVRVGKNTAEVAPVDPSRKKGTGPICRNGPTGASHKLDLSPFSSKSIVYNDGGWTSCMRYLHPVPMGPEELAHTAVGPLVSSRVDVYQFCLLGGHAVNYNSTFLPRVGEMMDQVDSMHVWRMRRTLRYLEDKHDTDPLHIICKACRKHGIACQFSLRMNDAHHTYRRGGGWYFPELQSPWFDEHKDALLPNYTLDYAHPDVHACRKRQIQEILDNYDVTGIDLDFTRFAPWFRSGQEKAGMSKMTQLVRELRAMTRAKGKTLSARFEYDPNRCIATGLDLETMLAERLFDQITLGVTGSHVPDAPIGWWVERTRGTDCILCPSMEGQLHWIPAPGWGGTGTLPAIDGVEDDYGPPSMAYMRAVASVQYMTGADGISLFNFTCADGPFDRAAFTELADPEAMKFKDKQYVARVWYKPFRMASGEKLASYPLRLSDDFRAAARNGHIPSAVLTLSMQGIVRVDDVEVRINDTQVRATGYHYNQSDHGSFSDVLKYDVPVSALRQGENTIELRRVKEMRPNFTGIVEVRKLILDIDYP